VTQGKPWIRFALPGVVKSLIERGLISGLAKPGALPEQTWNTLLRSVSFPIPSAHCHLRNFSGASTQTTPQTGPIANYYLAVQ
jgi:hypothetical protein